MKFRKKPVEIEAVQMPTSEGDLTRAPQWLHDAMKAGTVCYITKAAFVVKTLEGEMTGAAGDFVIKGVANELYPCKRQIFIDTYERVGSTAPLLGS